MQRSMRLSHKLLLVLLVWAFLLRLGYASVDLHAGRFFDESIPVENVVAFLEDPGWRPEHFWYQKLSYLPEALLLYGVDALHRLSGVPVLEVYREDRLTPTAYFLCRFTHGVYGTLSLLWTFLLGRRLFSEATGLTGALLLSIVPWHIASSGRFKPDVLLLLLTLVTLYELVRWIDEPRPGRCLRVGVGVGLTTATKLNGGVVVIPLLLFPSLRAWRNPRRLQALAAALLVAGGVYLTLDPWVPETLEALQSNRQHYAEREVMEPGSSPPLPMEALASLADPKFHGPWFALLALGGLVFVLLDSPRRHVARWLVLSYPVVYVLAYAILTDRFKENHLVQVIPFTSLLAAVAVVRGVRWVWSRLGSRWRRPALGWALGTVAVALLVVPSHRLVYHETVPSTVELALGKVHLELPDDRPRFVAVVASEDQLPRNPFLRRHPLVIRARETLAPFEERTWRGSDAWIVPVEALDNEGSEVLARLLLDTPPARRLRLEPAGLFQARGPEVLVRLHPFELLETRRLEALDVAPDSIRFELPAAGETAPWVSLELWIPGLRLVDAFPTTLRAPGALKWFWVGRQGPGNRFVAPRFALPADGGAVELGFPEPLAKRGRPPRVLLHFWGAPTPHP